MNAGLDEGDILIQKELSLKGSINEIFDRMQENDFLMIQKIIQEKYTLRKQSGISSKYKRRSPKDSELKNLNHSKKYLYNFIRMLQDPYPNAFIKIGNHKLIFKEAFYNGKKLSIHGEIK